MKSYVQNYKIDIEKINNKEKIVCIADLHGLKLEKIQSVIDCVNDANAKLVAISGDIMQGYNYDNPNAIKHLERTLSALSENQPVVLCLGNHDLVGLTENGRINFKKLEQVRPGQIFPLDNEQITIDNYHVTGFCPTRGAFKAQFQNTGEAHEIFAKDFIKTGLKVGQDKDKIEILMSHAPHSVVSPIVQNLVPHIRNFDVILSGHLHNGYILSRMHLSSPERYMDYGVWELPYEKGKIRPWICAKTNLCRGVSYVNEKGQQLIQLSNNLFYYVIDGKPLKIGVPSTYNFNGSTPLEFINKNALTPIVITGGLNKFASLPIDKAEVTTIEFTNSNVLKKIKSN